MNADYSSRYSRRSWLALATAMPAFAQMAYKPAPTSPPEYRSPNADDLLGAPVDEVAIGYFGPDDPAHPAGGTIWMGASLAIEEANAAGGYRGLPFRLLPAWSDDVWRAAASVIARLAYQEKICALIGGIDGSTTHLALQIAAKALFPVIDPVSTDETVNHAGVPWAFSWARGNRSIAADLQAMLHPEAFVLVAGTDHDSRLLAEAFLAAGRQPALRIDTSGLGHPGIPRMADQVVVIAPPACTIACAEAFPARTRILAGPSASTRTCAGIASRVETPVLVCPDLDLRSRMEQQFSQGCDALGQLSFEATKALIASIREVGPSRSAIRDLLASRMPPGGRRKHQRPCAQ